MKQKFYCRIPILIQTYLQTQKLFTEYETRYFIEILIDVDEIS